jgi:hypothetical protein
MPFSGGRPSGRAPNAPRAAGIATYAFTDSLRSEEVGADDVADHSG